MMTDDDLVMDDEFSDRPEPSEPKSDPNSLVSILAKAIREVDEIGGVDRARLSSVVGRKMYDAMMGKKSGRAALDAWLGASPKTKPAATRMLALAVAREAERPDLVDRIAREIDEDVFGDRPDEVPAKSRLQPRHTESLTVADPKIRAQQRSGQRVADPDLLQLAKQDDISQYRQARLNLRGRQRQHRHGV